MKFILPRTIIVSASFLFFAVISAIAQPNIDGIPFVTNYDLETYMAEESNWSVTQDDRGVMYFGNDEAVLEYDGTTWRKIKVPGQLYIYSLASAKDGNVYVGGVDDFGRLVVDDYGMKVYQSLKFLINDSSEVSRVWKTYVHDNQVFFCTYEKIFNYKIDQNKLDIIDLKTENGFLTYSINDKLYLADYVDGVLEINGHEKVLISDNEAYINKDIFAILDWSGDTLLVATKQDGLTLLDVETGSATPYAKNAKARFTNKELVDATVYSGVKVGKDRYAFGTINNGIYVVDRNGNLLMHLNEKNGMQDNVVSNLYYSGNDEGILWATLLSGITSVNIKSQVGYFSAESGLDVALYGIADHKGQLFVSTLNGVYKMKVDQKEGINFSPVRSDAKEITYDLLNFVTSDGKEILLAASVNDLYRMSYGKLLPLGLDNEINRIVQSQKDPNVLYAGTAKGIKVIRYNNGKFENIDGFLGLKDKFVSQIVEDKDGNLWYNTLSESVFVDTTGEIKPLPESIKDKDGFFFGLNQNVYFTSGKQVFKYNYSSKEFESYAPLQKRYGDKGRELKKFFTLSDTTGLVYYGVNHKSFSELLTSTNDRWCVDSTGYKLIPSMSFNSAYQNEKYVMLGGQEGLFLVRTLHLSPTASYNTILRKVIVGVDSVYYYGNSNLRTLDNDSIYVVFADIPLAYNLNNITFQYSSLFFERESDMLYSSFLEGFDEKWTAWGKDVSRGYTNLKEGSYQFHVKAKNIYGVESKETIFKFGILPPWYRTWWAMIGYLVIAFVIIRIFISLYTRKLQEDKKRLEKIVEERTAEIIEKNHRIERQNIAITDSIKYAKRIQNAVLPDKQTSGLFEYFIYFKPKDIVSGDFYWVSHLEKQNRLLVVAADCTGHGVPGAFMSMLGTSFLNEIVAKLEEVHSEDVLNLLREKVITTLSQGAKGKEEERQKDGMDMALASINLKTLTLEFSGANNPLVLIRDGELIEYKPDKMPIGTYVKQHIPFTRKEIELKTNDIFYLFSDGFVDQFGGPRGRKYMKKRFKEYLFSIHDKPMQEQRQLLNEEMFKWMDGQEQIDDQIVIGMRLIK